MPRGGTVSGSLASLTPSQTTSLLTRLGTNGVVADPLGSQASQLRAIAESLTHPAPSLTWLASNAFSISDSTVTSLPSPPANAIQAVIQFQYSDENIKRIARSTLNGTDPTQTLGWFEYNDSITSLNTRAELIAYRIRRLDTLGALNGRVAYYG